MSKHLQIGIFHLLFPTSSPCLPDGFHEKCFTFLNGFNDSSAIDSGLIRPILADWAKRACKQTLLT